MKNQTFATLSLIAAAALTWGGLTPKPANACGGFFCSAANPVNQAAEQIIFSDNGDGTITAVIQIMYEGPAESFAWLLPIPGVPDVEVSSNAALDRLNNATNPTYQLNTVFDGDCNFGFPTTAAAPMADGDFGNESAPNPVSVLAEKQVGPYDSVTISVDPTTEDAAQAAVDWLTDNGYDVTDIGPDVLRPYLDDGLNLVAFRLTKGNSSGAIRPVMITYDSDLPLIPIRPTAVAAAEDMPIKVWVLSNERAIPKNYKGLILNEALIDWFNPSDTYNEVVSKAADEAGGQGFVTEFAGSTDAFMDTIVFQWERQTWMDFSSTTFASDVEMYNQATQNWSGWDGFDEALAAAVTLPEDVDFDDLQLCFLCYSNDAGFAFDQGEFLTRLFEDVIKPMWDTQELVDSRPYMTRLYTTMSADEMSLDPIFDFNPDLGDVSNVHVADRVVGCPDNGDPNAQPWTVELDQGDTVMGTEFGVWPIDIEDEPAALQILQYGTSGEGEMVTDNGPMITDMINDQNDATMNGDDEPAAADPGGPSMLAGDDTGDPGLDDGAAGSGDGVEKKGDSGCAVGGNDRRASLGLWAAALGLLALRRRRRAG